MMTMIITDHCFSNVIAAEDAFVQANTVCCSMVRALCAQT